MALHCPATLLIARPGDEAWTRGLAQRIATDHVVRVWSDVGLAERESARVAAELLAVSAATLAGLDGTTDGGGFREAVGHIADLHRGETVLVLARGGPWESDGPVRLEVGDDGWLVVEPQNNR